VSQRSIRHPERSNDHDTFTSRKTMKRLTSFAVLAFAFAGCSGEKIYISTMEHRAQQAGLVPKTKAIGSGLFVRYYENSIHSDRTLVLLHGFTDSKETWLLFAKKLHNKYHLIVPDQIGYGESSKPMGIDYSLDAQSRRLHTFLSLFGSNKFALIGNSMGGGVALTYASKYPVSALVLVDAMSVKGKHEAKFSHFAQTDKQRLIYKTKNKRDMRDVINLVMERRPYVPSFVLKYLADMRRKNNPLTAQQTPYIYDKDLNVRNQLSRKAKKIKIPTLIVWGKQDKLIDVSSAHALHRIIPNSQLTLYENVGHLPMQEVPNALARDVLTFLHRFH